MEEPKLTTLCQATKPPHPMTLKSLTTVLFATATSKVEDPASYEKPGEDDKFLCWTCRDLFGKSKKIMALKPCGHVICGNCFDTLAKESMTCPACDKKLEATAKGKGKAFIELDRQGTGFASGGQAVVETFGLAFQ
jgi:nitric oxide synthase-interacting protein